MFSGDEALARIEGTPIDVVISDRMMPQLMGMELVAALASRHPALRRRLIIMTGGAVTAENEQFLARKDITVLTKPVSLAELECAMAEVRARH